MSTIVNVGTRFWFIVGIALLTGWTADVLAKGGAGGDPQEKLWQVYETGGEKALQQQDYFEAEKQLSAALKVAGSFHFPDEQLVTSLRLLAAVYNQVGKYPEAKPLLKRALALDEKTHGAWL